MIKISTIQNSSFELVNLLWCFYNSFSEDEFNKLVESGFSIEVSNQFTPLVFENTLAKNFVGFAEVGEAINLLDNLGQQALLYYFSGNSNADSRIFLKQQYELARLKKKLSGSVSFELWFAELFKITVEDFDQLLTSVIFD